MNINSESQNNKSKCSESSFNDNIHLKEEPQLIQEDEKDVDEIYDQIQRDPESKRRLENFVSYLNVKKNKFDEEELLRVFDKLDIDKDKKISSDEIKKFLHSMRNPINKYYIEKMINEFDKNRDGNIGEKEFVEMMNIQKDKENNRDMKEIIEIFKIFDTNHDNVIGHEDLYHVMKALGENFTDSQCKNMINNLLRDNKKGGNNKKESLHRDSSESLETGITFAKFFELIKNFGDV